MLLKDLNYSRKLRSTLMILYSTSNERTSDNIEDENRIKDEWNLDLFPMYLWNYHESVKSDSSRTNNAVERFHNALRSALHCNHPSLWTLIAAFKKEDAISGLKSIQCFLSLESFLRNVKIILIKFWKSSNFFYLKTSYNRV